jgi:hypothetical protein
MSQVTATLPNQLRMHKITSPTIFNLFKLVEVTRLLTWSGAATLIWLQHPCMRLTNLFADPKLNLMIVFLRQKWSIHAMDILLVPSATRTSWLPGLAKIFTDPPSSVSSTTLRRTNGLSWLCLTMVVITTLAATSTVRWSTSSAAFQTRQKNTPTLLRG